MDPCKDAAIGLVNAEAHDPAWGFQVLNAASSFTLYVQYTASFIHAITNTWLKKCHKNLFWPQASSETGPLTVPQTFIGQKFIPLRNWLGIFSS